MAKIILLFVVNLGNSSLLPAIHASIRMILSIFLLSLSYAEISSYQDGEMISFYIALGLGIFFIGLMINNIIQVNRTKKKPQK